MSRPWPLLAGSLALCIGLPLALAGAPFAAYIVTGAFLQLLFAAGMNLLSGYTGITPLSFAGITGISAYLCVGLVMRAGWSFWAAWPVATLAAAFVGVLLGLPALRLRGFYFVLSSLVVQTVLTLAFTAFASLTNGDTGISQIPPPSSPFVAGGTLGGTGLDLLIALVGWAGVVISWRLAGSGFGRRLVAVREDPELAETLGVDVVFCKLAAFFISSLYAAAGGPLMAVFVGFISPRSFDLLASLNIWLMVAFGGQGSITGPLIGTLILAPLPSFLLGYYQVKDIIYGLLIITVTVAMPGGIHGWISNRMRPRLP